MTCFFIYLKYKWPVQNNGKVRWKFRLTDCVMQKRNLLQVSYILNNQWHRHTNQYCCISMLRTVSSFYWYFEGFLARKLFCSSLKIGVPVKKWKVFIFVVVKTTCMAESSHYMRSIIWNFLTWCQIKFTHSSIE